MLHTKDTFKDCDERRGSVAAGVAVLIFTFNFVCGHFAAVAPLATVTQLPLFYNSPSLFGDLTPSSKKPLSPSEIRTVYLPARSNHRLASGRLDECIRLLLQTVTLRAQHGY